MSLPGYDAWLERPYRDRDADPNPCPHCGEDPCDDPDEARAEARGLI